MVTLSSLGCCRRSWMIHHTLIKPSSRYKACSSLSNRNAVRSINKHLFVINYLNTMSQTGIPTFVCKLVLPCQPYSGRFVLKLNVTMRWVSETMQKWIWNKCFLRASLLLMNMQIQKNTCDGCKFVRWLSSIGKCQKSLYWNIKYEQIIYTPVKLNSICRHRESDRPYIYIPLTMT